jgi:hypothetical protein
MMCIPGFAQFHVKHLSRKVQKLVSRCDIRQNVKHLNSRLETEIMRHMPKAAGELCAVDFYRLFPAGRGGVRYILVWLDVSNCVLWWQLLPGRAYRTYQALCSRCNTPDVYCKRQRNAIHSPVRKKKLADLATKVKFSLLRRPQANPCERFMKDRKIFKIYCF